MRTAAIKKHTLHEIKITVDPTLDDKFGDKVLFPEKVARAKEILAKHPVPKDWNETK